MSRTLTALVSMVVSSPFYCLLLDCTFFLRSKAIVSNLRSGISQEQCNQGTLLFSYRF